VTIIIANGSTLYEEKKRKEIEKISGTPRANNRINNPYIYIYIYIDVYRADYEFDTLENL